MAIYQPDLFLNATDRELLILLSDLIESNELRTSSNTSGDVTPLSNLEASRLLELLEEFVLSRRFVEGSYLVENLFGETPDYRALREVYLSGRRAVGKSRAVATIQWENLLARIGVRKVEPIASGVWYRANARPMPLDHFMRMERKLANAASIHPRVKSLILVFVQSRLEYIDDVRSGKRSVSPGSVSGPPKELVRSLKQDQKDPLGVPPMKTEKLVGIITVVMDLSVLYTTRDWSVASFLSTIAGTAPHIMQD